MKSAKSHRAHYNIKCIILSHLLSFLSTPLPPPSASSPFAPPSSSNKQSYRVDRVSTTDRETLAHIDVPTLRFREKNKVPGSLAHIDIIGARILCLMGESQRETVPLPSPLSQSFDQK
jgi:hypothetical protein